MDYDSFRPKLWIVSASPVALRTSNECENCNFGWRKEKQTNPYFFDDYVLFHYFLTSQLSSECVLVELAKAVASRLPISFLLFEFSVTNLVFAMRMAQRKLSYLN